MIYEVTPTELIKFIKEQPPERELRFDQSAAIVGREDFCGCLFYQFLEHMFPQARIIRCGINSATVTIKDPFEEIDVEFPYPYKYFRISNQYQGLQAEAQRLHPEIFQSV